MRNACFAFMFVFVFSFSYLSVNAQEDFNSNISDTVVFSEVDDSYDTTVTSDVAFDGGYRWVFNNSLGTIDFSSYTNLSIDDDSYYILEFDGYYSIVISHFWYLRLVDFEGHCDSTNYLIHSKYSLSDFPYGIPANTLVNDTFSSKIYIKGSDLKNFNIRFSFLSMYGDSGSGVTCNVDFSLSNVNIGVISGNADFETGYEQGYSVGYNQGQSHGYSTGYTDGYSSGETSGYNSGYQAGVESVDTQSYYDAGYSAGQVAGYAEGYDSGYDTGYNDAMARFESWGADNTNYPVFLNSYINSNVVSHFQPRSNIMAEYENINYFIDIYDNIDPTHTYKIEYYATPPVHTNDEASCGAYTVTLLNGGREYPFYCGGSSYLNSYYVKGSDFGDTIGLKVHATLMDEMEDEIYNDAFYRFTFQEVGFSIWDYGSSTGSQNETAKQTDDLIGGMQEQTDIVKGELESQTEQLEEQTETQKGILQKVTDFFGSFFENLKNAVVGLFVPSSDEMSELIDRMKEFFSDKFGFLYAPFDYLIQIVDVFLTTEGSTGLTFPGFSMMGYEVWPDMTYDLASDETVNDIFGYVRIGTGVLLGGWFIMYLQDFFKQRFGGQG